MANNLFKQSKKEIVKLDEFYSLNNDGFSGVILLFQEPRKREKEIKINNKKVKTGEIEDYIYEERFFYPNVYLSLKKYVELSQTQPTKTVEEILEVCKKINETLEEFKKYKNW